MHRPTHPPKHCRNTKSKSTQTLGEGDPLTDLGAPASDAGGRWASTQGLRPGQQTFGNPTCILLIPREAPCWEFCITLYLGWALQLQGQQHCLLASAQQPQLGLLAKDCTARQAGHQPYLPTCLQPFHCRPTTTGAEGGCQGGHMRLILRTYLQHLNLVSRVDWTSKPYRIYPTKSQYFKTMRHSWTNTWKQKQN